MKIKVPFNLDDVKELKPVPAGQYLCEVKKLEPKQSSTGNPMIVWQFTIVEGEFKGMAPFFYNTVLVEQSGFSLKQLLEMIDVEWTMEGKVCVFESSDCIRQQIVVIATLRDYHGKPSNNVDGFLPA
jgi:hypothetical protein